MSEIIYDAPLASNYNTYHAQDQALFDLQVKKIYSYLDLNERSIVADAGCGAGRLVVPIAPKVQAIHGIELSEGMYNEAWANCEKLGNVVLVKSSWDDYVRKVVPGFSYKYDAVYFSMSLHQMGTKEEQFKIIDDTLNVLKPGGKILLITVSNRQFKEILLNKYFPELDQIDRNRFIDVSEFRGRYAGKVVYAEEHTVYKTYETETFLNMVRNKYISSLQLISDTSFKSGVQLMENIYKGEDTLIAPDCYTYITLEK